MPGIQSGTLAAPAGVAPDAAPSSAAAANRSSDALQSEGPATDLPLFDAVIAPNDSTTRHGRAIYLTVLAAYFTISLYAGFGLGAWPVTGYALLVLGFVVWAERADSRRCRQSERIRVWPDRTLVERIDRAGRHSASQWQTAWLRLLVEPGDPAGPRLRLTSHGRSEFIGSVLTAAERREFAEILSRQIARAAAG